jgi:hypothetical protein
LINEQRGEQLEDGDARSELTAQEARAGKELGVMRYVLPISLTLAVIAGIVVYLLVQR